MPKSKRDKKVSLTKTSKHGMDWKKKMVLDLREVVEKQNGIYVFRVIGMRGPGLRELRRAWRDSTIFLGKNKVTALALGKSPETEIRPNIHEVTSRLVGECGILCTDKSPKEVVEFFNTFIKKDYARGGTVAKKTIELKEGQLTQFSHSIEPHLRSLGLPTALKKGVVHLTQDYTVCKKGQTLNPEQAKILKLLDIQMAEFRLVLDCSWTPPDCFEIFSQPEEEDDGSDENETEEAMVVSDEDYHSVEEEVQSD